MSSLSPIAMQALICSQDWLKHALLYQTKEWLDVVQAQTIELGNVFIYLILKLYMNTIRFIFLLILFLL